MTMEDICGPLDDKRLTMFNDDSPTIGWATKIASKRSLVAEHLVQALALCVNQKKHAHLQQSILPGSATPSPIYPHDPLGATCDTDNELLTLFNSTFPLPSQQTWTVFHLNYRAVRCVISALWMQPFVLDDWRQLLSPGKLVGDIGAPTLHIFTIDDL
jgi:hypothetical protein